MDQMDLPFKGRACWQLNKANSHNISSSGLLPEDIDTSLSILDYIKALLIILITFAIIILNILMITVLHSKHHSRYLRELPKILMTSLACTDLAVGTLVTPVSLVSMVMKCWPWSKAFCAVEALLLSALFHESTLSLVLIAVDRYICIVHPLHYHSLMTKKVCYMMVFLTWIISFSVYSVLIYPNSEYHYDQIGSMTCEPFYAKKYIIVAAAALFYIPPAVILVYCYVTILRVAQKQIRTIQNSPPSIYSTIQGSESIRRLQVKEKKKTYRTLVTLGSMSAGFLIAITPWTLSEFISSLWEVDLPDEFEFITTWIAISNSFWNPILYGLLNKSFRDVAIDMINRFCCRFGCRRYAFGFSQSLTSLNQVANNNPNNNDESAGSGGCAGTGSRNQRQSNHDRQSNGVSVNQGTAGNSSRNEFS